MMSVHSLTFMCSLPSTHINPIHTSSSYQRQLSSVTQTLSGSFKKDPDGAWTPSVAHTFIFIPVLPLLLFVQLLHTTVLCTHTMQAHCIPMQRERNVGHQTKLTGRTPLDLSGKPVSRVKD